MALKANEKYKTCKNINLFFDNMEQDLVVLRLDSQTRTFCRCGEVFTSVQNQCPNCKSTNNSWFHIYKSYTPREMFYELYSVATSTGFRINKRSFAFIINSADELEVSELSDSIFMEKDKTGLNFPSSNLYAMSQALEKLKKIDFSLIKTMDSINYEAGFETFDFNKFLETFSGNFYYNKGFETIRDSDTCKYIIYSYLKNQVPWMFQKGTKPIPTLLGTYFQDFRELRTYSSLKDFLNKKNLKPFERFIECDWFYDKYHFFKPHEGATFESLSKNYQEILINYMEHYKFSAKKIFNISIDLLRCINACEIDENIDETFEKYLKDNMISCQEEVVGNYEKDLKWLTKLKLTKTHENIRNINFLRNEQLLKEKGYAENKIGVFMDSFYDNPLKACSYLKSKKALTKKEIDTFLEEQIR